MPFFLLTANLVMMLALVFKSAFLPPQIPLFYSKPQGEAQLVNWWFIFLLPFLLNLFFFLNSLFYKRYFFSNEFVKSVFYYLKIFLLVSYTVIFLKIIFLIT